MVMDNPSSSGSQSRRFEGDKGVKRAGDSNKVQKGFKQGTPAWYALNGVKLPSPLSGQIADAQKLDKPPTAQDSFKEVNPNRLGTGHLPASFKLPTALGLFKALKQNQGPLPDSIGKYRDLIRESRNLTWPRTLDDFLQKRAAGAEESSKAAGAEGATHERSIKSKETDGGRRKKVTDVAHIDETIRADLEGRIESIKTHGIPTLKIAIEYYDEMDKYVREEVRHVVDTGKSLARKISEQLKKANPEISQQKIEDLKRCGDLIKQWHDYLNYEYVNNDTGEKVDRPPTMGIKEYRQAHKALKDRPTARTLEAYAAAQRKLKDGESLQPRDLRGDSITTRFGKTYKRCERNDITDVKDPITGERVGVIQLPGVTIIFPVVKRVEKEDGSEKLDVSDTFHDAYWASVHVRNANGITPSADTIRNLGYAWGPIFIAHNNSTTATMDAVADFFRAHNQDPKYKGLWPMINGSQIAPSFEDYTHEAGKTTKDVILNAMEQGVKDEPVRYGNENAGAGDGCETADFPSGSTGCAFKFRDWTIAMYGVSNYGTRDSFSAHNVPLGRMFPASEVPLVGATNEGGGSISVVCVTDMPSGQLGALSEAITNAYVKQFNGTSITSHELAYVVSLNSRDSLPNPPNQSRSTGPKVMKPDLLSVPFRDELNALATAMVEELVLGGPLYAKNIEGNGIKGWRMPHRETAKGYLGSNEFRAEMEESGEFTDYISDSDSDSDMEL